MGNIKVTTRVGGGPPLTLEYHRATCAFEGQLLIVTHADPKDGSKLLSKLPLANVVQVMEPMPEKAS